MEALLHRPSRHNSDAEIDISCDLRKVGCFLTGAVVIAMTGRRWIPKAV